MPFADAAGSQPTKNSVLGIVEYTFERRVEGRGNSKCGFQRGRVFSLLDCVDRLARDADLVGQILLRHFAMLEA